MADPLGNSVRMPNNKDLENSITAIFTYVKGGAGAAITVTLDSDYPPIKLEIQSPILGILKVPEDAGGARAVGETQVYLPKDQMIRGVSPDSGNEFQITGGRTLEIWETANKDGCGMITYIPKGTAQNT